MPYNEINGPSLYGALSVTSTPVQVKVGGANLEERKCVSIQPLDGDVFYGFDGSVSTSTGTKIFQGEKFFLECGDKMDIYLVSAGTIDTRIAEYA